MAPKGWKFTPEEWEKFSHCDCRDCEFGSPWEPTEEDVKQAEDGSDW